MSDDLDQGSTYTTRYTPWGTAQGQRVWVDLRGDQDTRLTRWGFDYELMPDKDHSGATVQMTIHHQKRGKADRPWDEEPFDLRTLKAHEALRFELQAEDTLALHKALIELFTVRDEEGVPRGEREFFVHDKSLVVAKGKLAEWIVALQADHTDEEIIAAIQALEPDLLASVAAATRNAQWSSALSTFEAEMAKRTWTEREWETFFRENEWLFGYGLDYQFMTHAVGQPNYGGSDIMGKGDQKGDFLLATSGDVRFSVVVEIKKPQTDLLGETHYRNGAWAIGEELADGVAQVQAQCDRWSKSAPLEENEEWRQETGIKTVQPKGILLIGHTEQLKNKEQEGTFQRFRRNLWNPEVMTYDELLARAQFVVRRADPAGIQAGATAPDEEYHGLPSDYEPSYFDEPPEDDGPPEDDYAYERWSSGENIVEEREPDPDEDWKDRRTHPAAAHAPRPSDDTDLDDLPF